jgi:hypothetical protein
MQKNPLEPLLMKLVREFTDAEDLAERLPFDSAYPLL